MKRIPVLLIFLYLGKCLLFAQVAINSEGSDPDQSAMLDVSSTARGLLVPRMTLLERDAISNPATGLLIFCTDDTCFYMNHGTASSPEWKVMSSQWVSIGEDIYFEGGKVGIGKASPNYTLDVGGRIGINDIQVLYLPDQGTYEGSLFLGNGGDYLSDDFNNAGHWNTGLGKAALYSTTSGYANTASGFEALRNNSEGLANTAHGHQALYTNTTGINNTAVVYQAMFYSTTAQYNVGVGHGALHKNTTGNNNLAAGMGALFSNTTGAGNTALGYQSLFSSSEGSGNTAVGYSTNYYNQYGSNNTVIGYEAGKGSSLHNKTGNIFIGYQAGMNETGNNKLYIENSSSSSPLIYGDFDENILRINGRLGIGTNSPHVSSAFDISSSSKGMLTPRLNNTERDAISGPATGLLIYNDDEQ